MPGQLLDRQEAIQTNPFALMASKARTVRYDLSGNYCAVQVDFGNGHTRKAVERSAATTNDSSVGVHSELIAIAKCINDELDSPSCQIVGNRDKIIFDETKVFVNSARQFFLQHDEIKVIGYSDRQPCKASSDLDYLSNDIGCERFLEEILPGERHKIDYSFEYHEERCVRKSGNQVTRYSYNNEQIKEVFRAEIKEYKKPKVTYLPFSKKNVQAQASSSTTNLPKDKEDGSKELGGNATSSSVPGTSSENILFSEGTLDPQEGSNQASSGVERVVDGSSRTRVFNLPGGVHELKVVSPPIQDNRLSTSTSSFQEKLYSFASNEKLWEVSNAEFAERQQEDEHAAVLLTQESEQSSKPLLEAPNIQQEQASNAGAAENPINVDSDEEPASKTQKTGAAPKLRLGGAGSSSKPGGS